MEICYGTHAASIIQCSLHNIYLKILYDLHTYRLTRHSLPWATFVFKRTVEGISLSPALIPLTSPFHKSFHFTSDLSDFKSWWSGKVFMLMQKLHTCEIKYKEVSMQIHKSIFKLLSLYTSCHDNSISIFLYVMNEFHFAFVWNFRVLGLCVQHNFLKIFV